MKSIIAVLIAGVAFAAASCPNDCSGRGNCFGDTQCLCWSGFTGADCSLRTCPESDAWAVNKANPHLYAECANRGICDRSTGVCQCFPGYAGDACGRQTCPNDCSGHGKCRTAQDLSAYDPALGPSSGIDWEEKVISACECDGGFFGPDCSLRKCPFGDDPETVCDQTALVEQVQKITATVALDLSNNRAGGAMSDIAVITNSDFALSFKTPQGANYTTRRIPKVWGDASGSFLAVTDATGASTAVTPNSIETALESLPNFAVRDVTVSQTTTAAPAGGVSAVYAVTFHHTQESQNNYGAQNLMWCHQPNACPFPGCQPKFTQLYGAAAFQVPLQTGAAIGLNDATAYVVPPAEWKTAVATSGVNKQYVRFRTDSLLSCPVGKTCTSGGITATDFNAGIGIIIDQGTATDPTLIYVKTFGFGNDGNKLSVSVSLPETQHTGLSYSQTTGVGVTAGYTLAGELTASNYQNFDISNFIPGAALEFADFTTVSQTGGFYSLLTYKLGECSVVDFTGGSVFSNADSENIECSGRGECDRATGNCACFSGYTGNNCGVQTVLV